MTLNVVDDVFTGLFALEMLIKVLAFGLIIPSPTAYLRDPWNVLDFVVVARARAPRRAAPIRAFS